VIDEAKNADSSRKETLSNLSNPVKSESNTVRYDNDVEDDKSVQTIKAGENNTIVEEKENFKNTPSDGANLCHSDTISEKIELEDDVRDNLLEENNEEIVEGNIKIEDELREEALIEEPLKKENLINIEYINRSRARL
jgi:hypothetical protein